MTGRVVVVGLGPGGPDLITAGVLDAIGRSEHRYLRTARHPAASAVGDAVTFDEVYESADTFADVYREIADRLIAAADAHGEVLYAVPGNPRVLERTVDLLDAAAAAGRIELTVLAGMSFLELAWIRLGVDPLEEGVRLADAHQFASRAAGERGPLLVAHCHNKRVLSDVKLSVEDTPDVRVTVLQRLGLPDEAVFDVAWEDLDRSFEPDHLTSLWIPSLGAPIAGELAAFVELVATLRRECPWDREQTHESLRRHLLEESYEVLEAIEELSAVLGGTLPDDDAVDEAYLHLGEELGDLLFQVVFHTALATEAGRFTMADVATGIHDKLVSRHPHVFAGAAYDHGTASQSWEEMKRAEKGRESAVDGIPSTLPALLYAAKAVKKAAGVGESPAGVASVDPALIPADEAALGDVLLAVVSAAREHGLDPELALRAAADRLITQVRSAGK